MGVMLLTLLPGWPFLWVPIGQWELLPWYSFAEAVDCEKNLCVAG
jgi:hypothetical protein